MCSEDPPETRQHQFSKIKAVGDVWWTFDLLTLSETSMFHLYEDQSLRRDCSLRAPEHQRGSLSLEDHVQYSEYGDTLKQATQTLSSETSADLLCNFCSSVNGCSLTAGVTQAAGVFYYFYFFYVTCLMCFLLSGILNEHFNAASPPAT